MEIQKDRSFRNVEMTTADPNDTYVIRYPVMEGEVVMEGNVDLCSYVGKIYVEILHFWKVINVLVI